MSNFATSVELYMTTPVVSAHFGDSLKQVQDKLSQHRISCLPVVDDDGHLVGVVSRTDLIRVGRLDTIRRPKAALLTVPNKRVEEIMTRVARTVPLEASVRDAAGQMAERGFHRVFVVDGQRLRGVFSTKDLMLAIQEAKLKMPLTELMSKPVFTVRAEEPIALATERLERAKVSGVVVIDEGWPVGIFTQVESLLAASMPRDTPVDEAMTHAMLCLPSDTPAHRAAAQARATRARRVIVTHHRDMVGICTGLDFARAAR